MQTSKKEGHITPNEEFVSFEEFRRLVGAAERAVRDAINEIPISPEIPLDDARYRKYPIARVDEVRNYVRQQRQQRQQRRT